MSLQFNQYANQPHVLLGISVQYKKIIEQKKQKACEETPYCSINVTFTQHKLEEANIFI